MQTILHFCLQALWNILLSKEATATTAKLDAKATSNALALRNPVGITIKKSALMALFLMVMRRLVNRQGKRKISADGVTSQVPEAKLARRRQALRSKTPIATPSLVEGVFVLLI